MARTGRPRKEINEEQFIKLCAIQCTEEEIANWFDCSVDTLERWCKRELEMTFADAYKRFSANGKVSLRRWQYNMAEHNCTMAIWLGKQWLGQRDQTEVVVDKSGTDETVKKMSEYFAQQKAQEGKK